MQAKIILFMLYLVFVCCFGCGPKEEYISTDNIHLSVDKSSYNIGDDIKILISIKTSKSKYLFLDSKPYRAFMVALHNKNWTQSHTFNVSVMENNIKKSILAPNEELLVEINGRFLKKREQYYLHLKGFGMFNIMPDEYQLDVLLKILRPRVAYDSLESIPSSNQVNIIVNSD